MSNKAIYEVHLWINCPKCKVQFDVLSMPSYGDKKHFDRPHKRTDLNDLIECDSCKAKFEINKTIY